MRIGPVKTGMVAMAAMFALAIACSPATQPGTGAGDKSAKDVPSQPQKGGAIKVAGDPTGPGHQDPHLVATASGRVLAQPSVDYLVTHDIYKQEYPIVPQLAKSWELSKDGLTYTFKLEQGVKFQNLPPANGREFTSEDGKYNLLRIATDPAIVSEKNRPKFQRRQQFSVIKEIETPDKYTLVVRLKEPYAPFLDIVAFYASAMLPKELIDQQKDGILTDKAIGTGPFITVDFKPQQSAVYKRNPDYWRKDLPHVDEVHLIRFADLQAELAAFRAGQIEVTGTGVTKPAMDSILKDNPKTKSFVGERTSIFNWRFNVAKYKPFQDVRVRRAVSLALDRRQIIELAWDGLPRLSGPVTPFFAEFSQPYEWLTSQPGYREDKARDLQEAKRLMKEAGYEDGFALRGLVSDGSYMADTGAMLVDQMKALNIKVKVETEEYGTWLNRMSQGDFDISLMSHTLDSDVDSLFSDHIYSKGGRNYGKYNNPELDRLIDTQRSSSSLQERKELIRKIEEIVLQESPMLFINHSIDILLVQPWVQNVGKGPIASDYVEMVKYAWLEK